MLSQNKLMGAFEALQTYTPKRSVVDYSWDQVHPKKMKDDDAVREENLVSTGNHMKHKTQIHRSVTSCNPSRDIQSLLEKLRKNERKHDRERDTDKWNTLNYETEVHEDEDEEYQNKKDGEECIPDRFTIKSICGITAKSTQNGGNTRFEETNVMQRARESTLKHVQYSRLENSQIELAGLFGCCLRDRLGCPYCNLFIQELKSDDPNLFEVHQKLRPECPFVLSELERRNSETEKTRGLSIVPNQEKEYNNTSVGKTLYEGSSSVSEETINAFKRTQESKKIIPLIINDEATLNRLVAARCDLTMSQKLVLIFKLSVIKRAWEDQLRIKRTDFRNSTELFIACWILKKQIEVINGNKENIIVPNVAMKKLKTSNADSSKTQSRKKKEADSSQSEHIRENIMVTVEKSGLNTVNHVENPDKQSDTDTAESEESKKAKTIKLSLLNPCPRCELEEKGLACIPCGHIVSCVACGRYLRLCCVCKREIQAFVRVFL